MPSIETALVILVPEAEALVGSFREKHDPAAATGMPAHITLLYPFKPPAEVGADVLENLQSCFARLRSFNFSLAYIRRFQAEVLYLAPEPDEPFRALTRAICDWHPETPPYGGKFADVIPHLTVAQVVNGQPLGRITNDFEVAARGKLPIPAIAAEVAHMDNQSGAWQVRTMLSLGSAPKADGLIR